MLGDMYLCKHLLCSHLTITILQLSSPSQLKNVLDKSPCSPCCICNYGKVLNINLANFDRFSVETRSVKDTTNFSVISLTNTFIESYHPLDIEI